MARLILKLRSPKTSANQGKNAARHIHYMATREGAVRNAQYIAYIAKREGAAYNKTQDFGLFGRYQNVNGTIASLKDAMRYVKERSESGTHIYKAILSVQDEDALQLGLDTRSGWEQAIGQHLHILAKEMDIPMQRFEWMASVHMEKGHPHMHLDFWDKEQGTRNAFVTPQKANAIREALTRAFFAEEMQPLFESRKQAKDLLKDETLGILGYVEAGIAEAKYAERQSAPNHAEILHLRSVQRHFARFVAQMNDIVAVIPQTGSIKQQYMPQEVKEKLRVLAQDIVQSTPQCANAMGRYLEASREITEMYSGKEIRWAEAKEKAENYVYKEIENQILKELRPLIQARAKQGLQTQNTDDVPEKIEADSDTIFQVTKQALARINRISATTEQERNLCRREEVSKQAKKERALQKQSVSTIDWSSEWGEDWER